ncbi:hypothetical protein BJX76DRAFT_350823 [Aspergillus varians]
MPTTPEPPTSIPKSNSVRLTRDNRIRVLALRDAGFTYQQIASQLQITYRQVQYTCQSEQATPRKPRGQSPKLSEEDVDRIIKFISSSKRARRLPYYKVIQELDLPPPSSDYNKHVCLAWALEHVYMTRKAGEELEETCLYTKPPKKRGWMFWALFYGSFKGPCLFWEKEWGYINAESYCHASQATLRELNKRRIYPISWPAFSPDLNPIETIWNWIEDWIQERYPEDEQLSYNTLQEVVRDLVDSMQARCQAVIDAEGGHTKY